jgi:sodium/bile acid cotransporter 7
MAVAAVLAFADAQLLPLSLLGAVGLGLAWPAPGLALGRPWRGITPVSFAAVVCMFFLTGLKLTTTLLRSGLGAGRAIAWGLVAILFLTVVVGLKLTALLRVPHVPDFGTGLGIFFAMPTTISACVIMSQQAGGNVGLALVLSAATNLLAIFTVPPMLGWLAAFPADVRFDVPAMILKLALSVLCPLLLGKAVEMAAPPVRRWTVRYARVLRVVNVLCLVISPWLSVSAARSSGAFGAVTAASFFATFGWGVFMHLLFVAINLAASTALCLARPEHRALVIASSQKTLPVALSVASFLPSEVGDAGLFSVAIIIAHVAQVSLSTHDSDAFRILTPIVVAIDLLFWAVGDGIR